MYKVSKCLQLRAASSFFGGRIVKRLASVIAVVLLAHIGTVNAVAGVTTWNDYGTQSGVACSDFLPTNSQGNNIFSATLSDLSPLWTGSRCQGSKDASKCNGHGSCVNCIGPACPGEQQCGHCFNIRCTRSLDHETSGSCTGNTVKDACPSTHPANYCKVASVPDDEACEASGVNAFDIAITAKSILSSFQGNLNIDIEVTSC
ncbi:uncharacterized protein EV420DRAFT_1627022 [Desarmillaria tabescens]|uniref:Expansin-like EG45 domain-containing protein n=1 Tax=Armillaria tabescens TaxID=1929756 RepID=A0AA39TW93_ARMTA|nr:uncharacterized protein EV420DRAFT_1627022 [Desarmillaria tabescens]KAK0465149.1 hypothetical protein EV420DRAFT_1627022 [Desarmillaria tabescens]